MPETITSKHNQKVADAAALKDKKGRKAFGKYLIEGRRQVADALKTGVPFCEVFMAEGFDFDARLLGCPVFTVTRGVLAKICDTETPQGIAATAALPVTALSDAALSAPPEGNCLILDRLADPGNVGAIIRTAAAAGFEDIYCIRCADPFSPKAVRASMSGIHHVRIRETDEQALLRLFASFPHTLVCADADGGRVTKAFSKRPAALIIGSEAEGVSETLKAAAALRVAIPMRHIESLNAAVSAGILMYFLSDSI